MTDRKKYMRDYMSKRRFSEKQLDRCRQKPAEQPTTVPVTLSQQYFGDPPPGRSALDQKNKKILT